ncbi:formyltetrahydrofolate deformylase [Sphingobium sp. LMA1-1-1.1]|uniref:formyltetrahydrofolate deformylase n=1 Tax=unclassified Sphingobium TaxID=2611147 RepID=UPI00343723CA
MTSQKPQFVIVLRCPDKKGIVSAVSSFLSKHNLTISESSQYQDPSINTFFMRVVFEPEQGIATNIDLIRVGFEEIAQAFGMEWELHDRATKPRLLIAVSKFGHCLYDLLHRWKSGLLPVEICGVVSNHDDMRSFVEWNGLPYYYLPVNKETKDQQEQKIIDLIDDLDIDLVVLARYMQILSARLCGHLAGRCINIHHSFLPSFKGAKPYHQAHARGVKMIGATAHYVTTDLDEGPIIAQDARHVSHAYTPEDLVALGQEVECAVLARAVGWRVDHRVISNGSKTVVFS